MAFYFALFNVSSVNLEENAKRSKYNELKKHSSSSRHRCKSADGRVKAKASGEAISNKHSKTVVDHSKHEHENRQDLLGSFESIYHRKPTDYRSQLSKPQVIEVHSGRKGGPGSPSVLRQSGSPSVVKHAPLCRMSSNTDSVGTATSLANGDIVKDDSCGMFKYYYEPNLTRRESTTSYKRVTFHAEQEEAAIASNVPSKGENVEYKERYKESSKTTEESSKTRNEQPKKEKKDKKASKQQPKKAASEPKEPTASPTFKPSLPNRFLEKLSSTTSPKIKRRGTWHLPTTSGHRRNPSPPSPLNKLRAVIKKLIVENRRQKLINNLKQAVALYQQQREETNNNHQVHPTAGEVDCRPTLADGDVDEPKIHTAILTLQNLQNQNLEEAALLTSQHLWTDSTAAAPQSTASHRRSHNSPFARSWSRPSDEAKAQYFKPNDQEVSLARNKSTGRRPHSVAGAGAQTVVRAVNKSRHQRQVEVKLKRRSATIMETNPSSNEWGRSSELTRNNEARQKRGSSFTPPPTVARNQTQNLLRHRHRDNDEKEMEPPRSHTQPQPVVIRRRSTTDKVNRQPSLKSLGSWAKFTSKKSSHSSKTRHRGEEGQSLLLVCDENANRQHQMNIEMLSHINGYENPLFVSLSAPNSPARVKMRERRKVHAKSDMSNSSFIESDLIANKRHSLGIVTKQPELKTSNWWWRRW